MRMNPGIPAADPVVIPVTVDMAGGVGPQPPLQQVSAVTTDGTEITVTVTDETVIDGVVGTAQAVVPAGINPGEITPVTIAAGDPIVTTAGAAEDQLPTTVADQVVARAAALALGEEAEGGIVTMGLPRMHHDRVL